jgi:lipopolysaccharide heptosyltransferase II
MKNNETLVNSLYRTFLARDPDHFGMKHFLALLESGATAGDLVSEITASEEYIQKTRRSGIVEEKPPVEKRLNSAETAITNIAVVKLDHIGDVVLSTPVYRALKLRFPNAHLTAIVSTNCAPLLNENPFISHIITYDAPWFWRESHTDEARRLMVRANSESLKTLFNQQFDIVVSLRSDLYNLVFSAQIPHRKLIGYKTHTHFPFLVDVGLDSITSSHVCDQHRDLCGILGAHEWSPPKVYTSSLDEQVASELLSEKTCKWIAIAPGAGLELKKWPTDRYINLAKHLATRGYNICIIGGKSDHSQADAIAKECGGLNLAGRLSLTETVAILKRCTLLVGNDSAPVHLAAAAGTRTLCITRPNTHVEFRPVGEEHEVIFKDSCSTPCSGFDITNSAALRATCSCIQSITLDFILSRLHSILGIKDTQSENNCSASPSHSGTFGKPPTKRNLCIRGDLRSYSGYAIATRAYIKDWYSQYDFIASIDLSYHPNRAFREWPYEVITDSELQTQIKLDPGTWTVVTISTPDNFFKIQGAHCVGLFFWETDRMPTTWSSKVSQMDEILVPAPFMLNLKHTYRLPVPFRVAPVPISATAEDTHQIEACLSSVELWQLEGKSGASRTSRTDLQSVRNRYSFLFTSINTFIPRKGFPILLSEWNTLAPRLRDAALVLKLSSIDVSEMHEQLLNKILDLAVSLCEHLRETGLKVFVCTQPLTPAQMGLLQDSTDAYVTASLGEGFGLGVFQALQRGKPVVCGRHTSFADFLPDTYRYFFDTQMMNVGLPDPVGVYPISSRWGVPQEGSVAAAMERVYSERGREVQLREVEKANSHLNSQSLWKPSFATR